MKDILKFAGILAVVFGLLYLTIAYTNKSWNVFDWEEKFRIIHSLGSLFVSVFIYVISEI